MIQLEDGSAAYVQHLPMPKAGTLRRPKINSGYLLICASFMIHLLCNLYILYISLMTEDMSFNRHITLSWGRSKARGWPNCATGGWDNSIHSYTQRYNYPRSYSFL